MPGHEYPVPRVTAQKNLLPVGIEPGTSRSEVRLTNHLASRTGITRTFKKLDFKITISANLKKTIFLDVTFNLENGKYEPFRKPGDKPLYINVSSNHPPGILRNIPAVITKRLSELSSDKEVFDEASQMYKRALDESGYKDPIRYIEATGTSKKRNRQRNINDVFVMGNSAFGSTLVFLRPLK